MEYDNEREQEINNGVDDTPYQEWLKEKGWFEVDIIDDKVYFLDKYGELLHEMNDDLFHEHVKQNDVYVEQVDVSDFKPFIPSREHVLQDMTEFYTEWFKKNRNGN